MFIAFHNNNNTVAKAITISIMTGTLLVAGCRTSEQDPIEQSEILLEDMTPILDVAASDETARETGITAWRMYENPVDAEGKPTGGMFVGLDAQEGIVYSAAVEVSYEQGYMAISTSSPFEDGYRLEATTESGELETVTDTLSPRFHRLSALLKADIQEDYAALAKQRSEFLAGCELAVLEMALLCVASVGALLVLVGAGGAVAVSTATGPFGVVVAIVIGLGSWVLWVAATGACFASVSNACNQCGWSCSL